MSTPAIGNLRRRVAIESATRTADGGGGVAVAWSSVATVWAEIKALSGAEAVIAEGLQGKVTHEIMIRKRMDVSPAMRLRYGARIFVIWAVLDRDGPDPFIRIQAEERLQ
jgi:SPP1 family predicted phage head-tail adaptor